MPIIEPKPFSGEGSFISKTPASSGHPDNLFDTCASREGHIVISRFYLDLSVKTAKFIFDIDDNTGINLIYVKYHCLTRKG